MGTSLEPANYAGESFYDFIDEVVYIDAGKAITTATEIARSEGILMGGSGGAACQVMRETVAPQFDSDARLLALIPDHGSRYTQTQFDVEWLESMGISVPALTSPGHS
jgi:cysteine synthase